MKYAAVAVVVLCVAVLATGPAGADSCRVVRHRRAVVQHHVAPVVAVKQAVVTPIVAVKQAVVTPIAVAAFAAYTVAVPHYSVGYSPEGGELQELRKSVKELTQALQALKAGASAPQQGQQPQANDIRGQAQLILAKYCAQCHTGPASKGEVTIFTEPGRLNPDIDPFVLWETADSGQMPPAPAKPIPDEEANALKQWVRAVAAEKRQALKQQP